MCVVDKRNRRKREDKDVGEKPGDSGNWLSGAAGNRLARCTATTVEKTFGELMLKEILAI